MLKKVIILKSIINRIYKKEIDLISFLRIIKAIFFILITANIIISLNIIKIKSEKKIIIKVKVKIKTKVIIIIIKINNDFI